MAAPRILFLCDSGPQIGGGHVMRSLTLAQALTARGANCAFLAPPPVLELLSTFAPADVAPLIADAADLPAAASRAAADALVFDHFRIDAGQHRIAAAGRPSLCIDDLADRPLQADVIVDLGPDRRREDYQGLVPANADLLLGPSFAFVRPSFLARRQTALAGRRGPVRRILVSLGLTDVGGVTARVVRLLLKQAHPAEVVAVVGRDAPSLPALRSLGDPRLKVVVEAKDMDRLMADADLAIGAGGSSTWERCTLGLPTLLLVLAANQAPSAEALRRRGAAVVLDVSAIDFDAAFGAEAVALLADDHRRAALSQTAAALCDGRGADRVAEHFLARLQRAS